MIDIAIRGGTVVSATGQTRGDVGIAGERVVAIGEVGPARSDLDARGKLVLPGAVDMHTHLGQGIETMASGTRDAAAGGVTTVLAFAQQAAGESLLTAAQRAVDASSGALIDFAFHVVVTDPGVEAIAELPELVRQGHAGLKVFMVAPQFSARSADYLRLLRAAGRAGALTAVHAEDHAIIALRTEALLAAGQTAARFFTASRLVDLLCATPARLAGLAPRKGSIAVGADADVVVLDPALTRTVRSADLRSNADHDPFDGWEVTGWPVLTISRGVVVARDGEIVGRANHGRFVPRAPFRR